MTVVIPRLRAASLLLAAWVLPQQAASESPSSLSDVVGASIDREHAAGRFDGVVLVGRGDSVVFQRAVGESDRAHHVAHRVDEPWRLASVSKQVASLLAMQQVEKGTLSLDAAVHGVLPAFASPLADRLTLRQLLQHTSGLPNPDATLSADVAQDALPPYYTRPLSGGERAVDAGLRYCAGTPSGVPGGRFSYNNCDTLIVEALLERVTGRPYEQLLADEVARPLGLSSWRMVTTPGSPPETPIGYLDGLHVEPAFNLANFGASGALIGSPQDLWRFDRALIKRSLLGEAATRTMWTGDAALGYVALGAWAFPATLAGCRDPVQLVERRGEIGGVQVRNLIAPELNAALIVLSNTAKTDFGEIWQARGWAYELAAAAFCAKG